MHGTEHFPSARRAESLISDFLILSQVIFSGFITHRHRQRHKSSLVRGRILFFANKKAAAVTAAGCAKLQTFVRPFAFHRIDIRWHAHHRLRDMREGDMGHVATELFGPRTSNCT